jgi:hypothetical protein
MLYFFRFIYTIFHSRIRLKLVRKRAAKQAERLLGGLETKFNGKFDDKTYHKIVKSYSLYLPLVTDTFTFLHGRYNNLKEQEKNIHYFICSSLFDNFWDDKSLNTDQLEQISFDSARYTAQSFAERVFITSKLFLENVVKDKEAYKKVCRQLFEAQKNSLLQFDKNIPDADIENITFEKGGNAVLLCRYYLDINATRAEEDCWYYLGSLIQLSNDLFDIFKDLNDHIQTLATRCTNAYAMEDFFLTRLQMLKTSIKHLPFPKKRKQYFSILIIATACLGLVAIAQLKRVQGDYDKLPPLKKLPRKALIIDMELFSNVYRWLKLIYTHARL